MSVCQLVGYPGRPRGGLTIVPSRHPQQVPTPTWEDFARALWLPLQANTLLLGVIRWRNATCASLFKSAPPRTLPVAPFHSMAPCPLDLCVLDHTWRVRCLESCPVSLLALGGLAVPPPDIFRHSAPSPRQVSRQGHTDQQSWFFEPHHPPVEVFKCAPSIRTLLRRSQPCS